MKPVYQFHNGGPVRTYLRSGPPFLIIATYVVILVACGRTYVAEEVPNTFEMPAGVAITVDLVTPAQPEEIEVGESFTGTLAEPLYYPRQKVEPDGEVFEEETLVAPVGAPVAGVGVAVPEAGVGLQLEAVTFHGGMTFPVETAILVPPAASQTDSAENANPSEEVAPLTFTLSEPADVAMVIDYRDKEIEGQNN